MIYIYILGEASGSALRERFDARTIYLWVVFWEGWQMGPQHVSGVSEAARVNEWVPMVRSISCFTRVSAEKYRVPPSFNLFKYF